MTDQPSSPQEQPADSIVLEEEIDPNYVPSEQEVLEYVNWLGMDLEVDKDLFWIAREGLMAPLPANWKPCKIKSTGDIYYFNFSTGESTWDHPCDEYYKRLYEEEKKKKEISIKEGNDSKRAQAKQDMQALIGKEKKPKKTKLDKPNLIEFKNDSALAPVLERKPLPQLKLSNSVSGGSSLGPLIEPRPNSADTQRIGKEERPISRTPISLQSDSKDTTSNDFAFVGKPLLVDSKPLMKQSAEPISIDSYARTDSVEHVTSVTTDSPAERVTPPQKSTRNFLALRGHDEESQQKAIAANIRASAEMKESAISPGENVATSLLISQLEQENAKLLSKLAFHEIELKNCKSELDSLTYVVEKNRQTTDELQRSKAEVLSKQEELFELKSQVRRLEMEVITHHERSQSMDVDHRKQLLELRDALESERSSNKTLEYQNRSLQQSIDSLQSKLNLVDDHSAKRSDELAMATLKEELDKLRSSREKESASYLMEKRELMEKILSFQQGSQQLENRLNEQRRELEAMTTESQQQQALKDADILSLRTSLKNLQDLNDSKDSELTGLRIHIQSLEERLRQEKKSIVPSHDADKDKTALTNAAELNRLISAQQIIESENSQLKVSLNNADMRESQLNEELTAIRKKMEQQLQAASEQFRESQILADQLAQATSKTINIESKYAALEVDLRNKDLSFSKVQSELASALQELQLCRTSMSALSDDRTILQTNLAEKELQLKAMDQLRSEFDQNCRQLTAVEVEREDLINRLKLSDIDAKHLKQQLAMLQEQVADMRANSQLSSEESEVQVPKHIADELEVLRGHVRSQDLEVTRLREVVALREATLAEVGNKNEEFRLQAAGLRKIESEQEITNELLQSKERELQDVKSRHHDLEAECIRLRTLSIQVQSLQSALVDREEEFARLRKELAEVRATNVEQSLIVSQHAIQSAARTKDADLQVEEMYNLRSENARLRLNMESLQVKLQEEQNRAAGMKHELDVAQSALSLERENRQMECAQELATAREKLNETRRNMDLKSSQLVATQRDLENIKEDFERVSSQLAAEQELTLHNEKRSSSYREQILQLQKRLSQRDQEVRDFTEKLMAPKESFVDHIDAGVQCCFGKETKNAQVQCIEDFTSRTVNSEQSRTAIPLSTVGQMPSAATRPSDNDAQLQDIRLDLERQRKESASLLSLLKQQEANFALMVEQQQQARSEIAKGFAMVHNQPNNAADDSNKHRVPRSAPAQHVAEDAQSDSVDEDYEDRWTDFSDELKSLSGLQSTVKQRGQCTEEFLLDATASLIANLSSAIFALRMNSKKNNRLVDIAVERKKDLDILAIWKRRIDREHRFLCVLKSVSQQGKNFVRQGRSEVEKLKSLYKNQGESSVDKEQVNLFTEDLNSLIRLVRSVQDVMQSRESILSAVTHRISSLSKVSPSIRDYCAQKFDALEKELDEMVDTMHSFSNSKKELPSTNIFDSSNRRRDRESHTTQELQVLTAPTQYQNFMLNSTKSDKFSPSTLITQGRTAFAVPAPEIFSQGISTAGVMRDYSGRISEIQKQLSDAQSKQADTWKECDRHVNWLGGLMKDIDFRPKAKSVPNTDVAQYPSLDPPKIDFQNIYL